MYVIDSIDYRYPVSYAIKEEVFLSVSGDLILFHLFGHLRFSQMSLCSYYYVGLSFFQFFSLAGQSLSVVFNQLKIVQFIFLPICFP